MNTTNFKHLALLLAATLVLPSCGSDEPDPNPNPDPAPDANGTWVITEYSNYDSQNDYNRLTYDSKGRVIRLDYGDDDGHHTETYEYSPTIITLYEGSGSDRRADMYYALSSGLVTQEFDDESVEERYEYNSARQLTTRENGEFRVNFNWNGGNITRIIQNWSDHPVNCEVLYGDYSEMNSGCKVPLNRWAMTMICGCYPPMSLGGFFGEVPARLITGSTDTADGMLNAISYSDFDANGCPLTMVLSFNGEEDTPVSLKWRQLR